MEKGKLIVVDGLDGTGKATQVALLREYFIGKGYKENENFAVVDFPRYGSESARMVELYLSGKLGNDPSDVDPYTASLFYAIDRSISFKNEVWGKVYRNGGIVIADRYTSSNILHQTSKLFKFDKNNGGLDPENPLNKILYALSEFRDYVHWLYDLEYNVLKIPNPDMTIYLKLSEEANTKMLKKRENSAIKGDIHENNHEYLDKCRIMLNNYQSMYENFSNCLKNPFNDFGFVFNTNIHKFVMASNDNDEPKTRVEMHYELVCLIEGLLNI